MSEVQVVTKNEAPAGAGPNWPAPQGGGVSPPMTQASLLNAAARASASNSRRDLIEYLRLRRKSA
jgi:hypothetical protein